jgi:hypothetical protein
MARDLHSSTISTSADVNQLPWVGRRARRRRPVTEETIMAMPTTRQPLPLTRDLAFAFRLTDATATLLVGASIAGLLYGPHGWWYDANPATLPAFLGQDVMSLSLVLRC